jgi:hypothetical protein
VEQAGAAEGMQSELVAKTGKTWRRLEKMWAKSLAANHLPRESAREQSPRACELGVWVVGERQSH